MPESTPQVSEEMFRLLANLGWLEERGALAGVAEVIYERRRQLELGWTLEHDDQHDRGQLAYQAAATLMEGMADQARGTGGYPEAEAMLKKAGALCAAEIDRVNRLLAPQEPVTRDSVIEYPPLETSANWGDPRPQKMIMDKGPQDYGR